MELLLKHFWLLFIPLTLFNVWIIKGRTRKFIDQNPALEAGYDKFFKGFLFYGNLPWLVMMLGSITGLIQDPSEFLAPREMNPIVLLFHFTLISLWILGVRWIYFKNGAEFLETHPGLINNFSWKGKSNVTAKQIKFTFPFMLLGGVIAMILMWVMDLSIPQL